jgi:transposase
MDDKSKFAFKETAESKRLRAELAEYVQTLTPDQQAWATDLRQRLDKSTSPEMSESILRMELDRLEKKLNTVLFNLNLK